MKRLLMAVGLVLSLSACESKPVAGVIEAMDYDPVHVSVIPHMSCYSNGKSTSCRTNYITVVDSEDWSIQVCNGDDGCVWVEVSEEVYKSLSVGDRYDSVDYQGD